MTKPQILEALALFALTLCAVLFFAINYL